MPRDKYAIGAFALSLCCISTSLAHAAPAQRTFVSGLGSDANACSITAPCRSFGQALSQVAAGGEVTVLDSAGYGRIVIDKSVTITSPGGVEAAITASGGATAITINATSMFNVTLRGLTLDGLGTGANGIDVVPVLPYLSPPSHLAIIDCVVRDFASNGILLRASMDYLGEEPPPAFRVSIVNTMVLNNAQGGLMVDNQAGPILVAASRLTAAGNTTGVYVSSTYGFPNVVVSDSSLDLNTLGVDLRVFGTMTLRNSTVKNSFLSDITNTMGVLFLLDHNTIGIVENHSGGSQSDGTNNIGSVLDIALVKVNPQ